MKKILTFLSGVASAILGFFLFQLWKVEHREETTKKAEARLNQINESAEELEIDVKKAAKEVRKTVEKKKKEEIKNAFKEAFK